MAWRALPQTSGELHLAGLHHQVLVERDRWGIVHVRAQDAHDLFFAQGFAQAQDRLWQMELTRRTVSGTLSEVLGGSAAGIDVFFRTVGLRAAARSDLGVLDAESRAALDAHAQGINAFLSTHQGNLPVEFALLGYTPAPWQSVDSLSWGRLIDWQLASDWDTELLRSALLGRFGPQGLNALLPPYPAQNPVIVPPGATAGGGQIEPLANGSAGASSLMAALAPLLGVARGLPSLGGGGLSAAEGSMPGSNNWVVSGSRSVSGSPLLANDPHLQERLPEIWYAMELEGGGYHVAGLTLPGAPGVVLGHNQDLAWGATNVGADTQDLYVEALDGSNPDRYAYHGHWVPLRWHWETMKVKDEARPRRFRVWESHHGPLLNGALGTDQDPGLSIALRWSGLLPSRSLEAELRWDRAQTISEWRAAAVIYDGPPQNWVIACRCGHIAYQVAGWVPLRPPGVYGGLPLDGTTPAAEWTGRVPTADLPRMDDPPGGFIATANNVVAVDAQGQPVIQADYDVGFRAQRIVDALVQPRRFSLADFSALQGDVRSMTAGAFLPTLLALRPKNAAQRQALATLASWDLRVDAAAVAPTIFEVFYIHLAQNALRDRLGGRLYGAYGGGERYLALSAFAAQGNEAWLSAPTRKAAAVALEDALADLTSRFGSDQQGWQWGKLHAAYFAHVFDSQPVLGWLMSRGPVPTSGDSYTVAQAGYTVGSRYEQVIEPSARMLYDTGDWSKARISLVIGESGQVLSRHYDDFIVRWQHDQTVPLLWGEAAVLAAGAEVLTLQP